MVKVKPEGHIWALEFKRYVCSSFCGNWTIFGWDIANSIFDLEKSRSRSRQKSTKISPGNLQLRANNRAKNEGNPKSCSKVIAWTRICGRRRRRKNRYKIIKSSPVYRGDLNITSGTGVLQLTGVSSGYIHGIWKCFKEPTRYFLKMSATAHFIKSVCSPTSGPGIRHGHMTL